MNFGSINLKFLHDGRESCDQQKLVKQEKKIDTNNRPYGPFLLFHNTPQTIAHIQSNILYTLRKVYNIC
ncbi:hypothetical protein MHA01_23590 [Marinococcus halophilus]|uniref:Uncharacterized protein n=1 Tax=Marinococcus halophilus TaxID=1371 RepID=A0A510Y7V9_MARHA|nr:hypothetical protein MHA01_23590 [Marinococcus halophilus]